MPSKIFLTVSFLIFLVGCKDDIPITKVHIPDFKHGITSEWSIEDKVNLKFKHLQDIDISAADGDVCIVKAEWPAARDWIKEQQSDSEE